MYCEIAPLGLAGAFQLTKTDSSDFTKPLTAAGASGTGHITEKNYKIALIVLKKKNTLQTKNYWFVYHLVQFDSG